MLGDPISGVTVTPFRREHHPFVARLSQEAFAAYSRDPRASIDDLIAESAAALVATWRDQPVGFAVLRLERRERPFGPIARPVIAHLDAIAVTRRARRRGIGSALMTEVEVRAVEDDAIAVYLRTAVANSAARRLFEGHGYRNVARYPHAYVRDQSGLVMMKALPEPHATRMR